MWNENQNSVVKLYITQPTVDCLLHVTEYRQHLPYLKQYDEIWNEPAKKKKVTVQCSTVQVILGITGFVLPFRKYLKHPCTRNRSRTIMILCSVFPFFTVHIRLPVLWIWLYRTMLLMLFFLRWEDCASPNCNLSQKHNTLTFFWRIQHDFRFVVKWITRYVIIVYKKNTTKVTFFNEVTSAPRRFHKASTKINFYKYYPWSCREQFEQDTAG